MAVSIGTRALNWTCGLFATALAIAVLPFALFSGFWAWAMFDAGWWMLGVYNVVVTLLFLGVPVVFLGAYDRWQTRKGLQ